MSRTPSLQAIKALREQTSASISEVRAALESSGGDQVKALEVLRQRGAEMAQARRGRATTQGRVEAYVHHNGQLGALVEVNCETDFVARTPEFLQFCRDLAMHVAAMHPRYLRVDDAPRRQHASVDALKPLCLLEQPFVKDQGTTIRGLLQALVAKTGENVVIRRFVQFGVGESA